MEAKYKKEVETMNTNQLSDCNIRNLDFVQNIPMFSFTLAES